MKKFFYFAAAFIAMVFAASCQQEKLETPSVNDGELVDVVFDVYTSELQTKADDGIVGHNPTFEKTLKVGVYRNGKFLENANPRITTDFGEGLNAKVKVTLVKGQTYQIVFWADAKNSNYYDVNFRAPDPDVNGNNLALVTVDYSEVSSNDINRDAWSAVENHLVTDGNNNKTITLTRPLAQINVGTKDYQAAVNAGVIVTESAIKVTGLPNKIDLLSGKTYGDVDVQMIRSKAPCCFDEPKPLIVYFKEEKQAEYTYLSLNYVLAPMNQDLYDVQLFFYENGNTLPVNGENFIVKNVPIRKNYRTNLISDTVLTSACEFNVTIDPFFNGEYTQNGSGFENIEYSKN